MRGLCVVCAVLFVACGSTHKTALDPLDYLRVGVDPLQEAQQMAQHLREDGFHMGTWIEGQGFVAFDARRGESSLVRVVAKRGISLGVDAPERGNLDRAAVWLWSPRVHDLHGQGYPELIVALMSARTGGTCLAVVRVMGDTAFEVPLPLKHYGRGACVAEFRDVVGDARLEALVSVPARADWDAARVQVPLSAHDGGWRETPQALLKQYWEQEQRARYEAIANSPQIRDAYRIALEVPAVVRYAGGSRDAQAQAFAAAISQLALPAELREDAQAYAVQLKYAGSVVEPEGVVPEAPMLEPAPDSSRR